MKIKFKSDFKLAGLGITPWARLGLERWLPNYKIATYYGADIETADPEIFSLAKHNIAPLKMSAVLQSADFQKMVFDKLAGYTLITYKPFDTHWPPIMAAHGINIAGGISSQTLENKAEFRARFEGKLNFPAYKILDNPDPSDVEFDGRTIVLQDQAMSGRRGTFIINEPLQIDLALAKLRAKGKAKRIVVSEFIEGTRERSIQGVVTKYGVFMGHLQKQIVGNPRLCMPDSDKDKFCGAELGPADEGLNDQAQKWGKIVGNELKSLGYRGIFGIDFLLDKQGRLFCLEVNQRITGVTPLLTALYRGEQDIPFYLLHALEATGQEYEILDDSVDKSGPTGSLMVLHNKSSSPMDSSQLPSSGLYGLSSSDLIEITVSYGALDENSYLLHRHLPAGVNSPPGGRVAHIYLKQAVLEDGEDLKPLPQKIIESVYGLEA